MKNIKNQLLLIAAILFGFQVNYAQCPNNNIQFGTSNAPSTVGVTTILSSCLYGGEYRLVNNMQAGSQYRFETCGDSDFDTQITVYDATTGAFIAYNDDFCGLQSSVSFTSNGNPVRVLIDRYFCTSQSSCMTLRATRLTGGAPAVDPCNSITNLTCGSVGSFSLSGSGAWNPPGPWGTPGEEKVFSFTPTLSGPHQVQVVNQGFYVDLFVKAGSCGPNGWIYIDDIFSNSTNTLNLTAGVTYYLLIDDENTAASNGAIQITCPVPVADPCNSIVDITSCGNSFNYSLPAGNGAWNPPGPWGTPGNEEVFSYTPTVSGAYPVTVTHSGGFYVDLFVKTGSCGSTGWSYVDDIFSSSTNTFNLTAGVTYYFLIDDENLNASTGSITVGCPCIPPPGGVDATVVVNGNTSYSSTTVGACNDCSLRSSNDRVVAVEITCAGTYTFSTCGGASWDTYLYLTTAPCGGSIITLNDDNCGLQSSMTASLNPGTYYVAVEAFSSFSQGAFTLNITKACDLSVSLNADVKNCGYNISCYEGNDGSITAIDNGCGSSYAWSNGASSATATDLIAGTYSVVVTDAYGCTASASATLTEPDALVVDAGDDEIVFYGYDPMSCAALNGTAAGGCGPYTSSWSDQSGGNYVTVNASDNWFGFMNVFENPADPNPCCGGGFVFNSFWGVPDLATTLNGGTNEIVLQPNFNTYNANDPFWSDGNGGGNKIMDANTLIEPAGLNGQDLTFGGTVTSHTLDLSKYTAKFFIKALDPNNGFQDVLGGSAVLDLPLSGDFSVSVDGSSLAPGLIVQCGFVINGLNANPADAAALGSVTIEGADFASLTVCPSVSTDYTLTVTDANGCTSSDDVTVCAVDVICYAGNSGNQKVEMCQIPPGNPANAHTICVSPNAVPAHLAIGCTLGACGEIDATCNSSAMNKPSNNSQKTGIEVLVTDNDVNLYPNPAINEVNLEFSTQIDETFVVEFYDILGKKLEQLPTENFIGGNRIIHNISSFERGNYIYRITIGQTQITKSVNISR